MLTQAQDFILTGELAYAAPAGLLLVFCLVALAAIGALVESGVVTSTAHWLARSAHAARPVATASHRG